MSKFPKFRDVTDRQLQEAIKVVELEFTKNLSNEDFEKLSPAAKEALVKFRNGSVFDYLRLRLPELLGFVQTRKR